VTPVMPRAGTRTLPSKKPFAQDGALVVTG
jgi:hypothetical protein